MKIFVTSVLEFDEYPERARIEKLFDGEDRDELLALLQEFSTGDFAAAHARACDWPAARRQYLDLTIAEALGLYHRSLHGGKPTVEPDVPAMNQQLELGWDAPLRASVKTKGTGFPKLRAGCEAILAVGRYGQALYLNDYLLEDSLSAENLLSLLQSHQIPFDCIETRTIDEEWYASLTLHRLPRYLGEVEFR